jgi:hypothetical protein
MGMLVPSFSLRLGIGVWMLAIVVLGVVLCWWWRDSLCVLTAVIDWECEIRLDLVWQCSARCIMTDLSDREIQEVMYGVCIASVVYALS